MRNPQWQVFIADLVSSRSIPATDRAGVDRAVARAIDRTLSVHREHFRLGPQVLKGDEMQAVLRPGAPALSILTYLRAQLAGREGRVIRLRAGLGAGRIARLSPKGPFASEGEAFHRARAAIDGLKAGRAERLTGWITGDIQFDLWAGSMLPLLDAVMNRWTPAQWEAVAGRLETRGMDDIARRSGVTFQSVSKRLRAASWNEALGAMRLLDSLAGQARLAGGAATGARGPTQPLKGESRLSPPGGRVP
jgi:hypothetical protein